MTITAGTITLAMAGEPAIELDQLFNVGGESMKIPGDGSAENGVALIAGLQRSALYK